ncbi:SDR family NAD(P)-dependent oxidoreductase [Longispora urticae]
MTPVAVLTGASRGIGAAVLGRLVDDGFACVVVGLSRPAAGVAEFIRRDLSDPADVAAAAVDLRDVLAAMGRPARLLVNNAGGAFPRAGHELEPARVGADVTLNLVAPMVLASTVLVGMREAGEGSIVNVASTAGRTGVAYLHAYSAAKAGLIALTQSLAAEYADQGVQVNCVCPGAVATGSAHDGRAELSRLHGLDPADYEKGMASRTGLGRLLAADEVAEAVHWLGLRAGRAVNGQTLNVCGTLTRG